MTSHQATSLADHGAGRRSGAFWICLLLSELLGVGALRAQPRMDTLLLSGPTATRINIAVLSEGYTAAELGRFPTDALAVVNHLLGQHPYQAYRSYFNAFAISVASAQSGSDHPSRGLFRDTYFNSTYDSYGIGYLVSIPPNDRDGSSANGQGKVDALLEEFLPEHDIVLILVNDPDYGGSGGRLAVTSLNASSREIAVHELGHSFAGLGDEYSTPYPGYPDIEEPNTTRETRRGLIKWSPWISASTPIPTPDVLTNRTVVGLFEGAHYHATGWYRPKHDCKMNHLNVSFCEVCAEALVLAGYRLVHPIESMTPAQPQLELVDAPITFAVEVPTPTSTAISLQWFVNGAAQSGATQSRFVLQPGSLPEGTNTVHVRATDPTLLVRSDPARLLQGTGTWTVVAAAPIPEFRLEGMVADATGGFGFRVPATRGSRVVIEASVDGVAWEGVYTNLGSAAFGYTNRLGPASAGRFFRARSDP